MASIPRMNRRSGIVAGLSAILIFFSGCQTTGGLDLTGNAESALESKRPGQISKSFYSPFFDQGDHLKELIDKENFKDAAKLYKEQKVHFKNEAHRKKSLPLLQAIANSYNDPIDKKITPTLKAIEAIKIPLDQAKWSAVSDELKTGKSILANYPKNAILEDPSFRLSSLRKLKESIESAEHRLARNIDSAFTSYDLFTTDSFFEKYPVKTNAKKTFSRLFDKIAPKIDRASKTDLEQFLRTYPAETELPIEIYDRASRAYRQHLVRAQNLTDKPDLAKIFLIFQQLKKAGYKQISDSSEQIGFVEVTSRTLLKEGQIEFPAAIDPDFPITPVKADLDEALTEVDGPKYLVVFDVALAKTSRRVVDKKAIPSKVQTGTNEKPNPEYNVVQNEVNNARLATQQASMSQMSADAQFCQGWGCLGKAIGQIAAAAQVGKAQEKLKESMAKLNGTPLTITYPVYAKYKYEVASIKASKLLTVHYYIVDKSDNSYFKSSFDIEENKDFEVAYRVLDDDPDKGSILTKNSTEEEVVEWEEAPSTVKLSQLVTHYTDNAKNSKKIKSLVDLRREMLRDKNRALAKYRSERFDARPLNDPRFDFVVVVQTGDGSLGSGFFIKPDVVLTNWHVVRERKFVEMKLYDGQETFGKVLAKDARLDLALIRVQRRGKPVQFYTDSKINLGETVEAIGHPKGLEFSITRGVISSLRKVPRDSGKDVLFIQTDTPINKGNSGGPLFFGDRVIGVNTFGLVKSKTEGLNFSVHYSEILKFIKSYLPGFQV